MRRGALDHPALGLMLQMLALFALPQQLNALANIVLADEWTLRLTGVAVLTVAATALQLASGIAIATRTGAIAVSVVYVVATIAAFVAGYATVMEDAPAAVTFAAVIEMLGGPLLIALAPLAIRLDRTPRHRAPADVAAVLLVFAGAFALTLGPNIYDHVRTMEHMRDSLWSRWGWWSLSYAGSTATAILGVLAAVALLRVPHGLPAATRSARQAIATYAIVAMSITFTLNVVNAYQILSMDNERVRKVVMASQAISLLRGVAQPLLIWWYASRALDEIGARLPDEDRRTANHPSPVLAWLALWFAPVLASRVFVLDTAAPMLGSTTSMALTVLFVALAVVLAIAGAITLGGRAEPLPATIAAALALSVFIVVTVAIFRLDNDIALRIPKPLWPIAALVTATTLLAWFERRRTS